MPSTQENSPKPTKTAKIKRVQHSTTVRTPAFVTGSTDKNKSSLRKFAVNSGLPALSLLRTELDEYLEILMGREEPPISNGELTMLEYANAVYSRAMEITMLIQRAETDGAVLKGTKYYRFRTGELRTFTELALKCIDLGSRRVTWAKLEYDMAHG